MGNKCAPGPDFHELCLDLALLDPEISKTFQIFVPKCKNLTLKKEKKWKTFTFGVLTKPRAGSALRQMRNRYTGFSVTLKVAY